MEWSKKCQKKKENILCEEKVLYNKTFDADNMRQHGIICSLYVIHVPVEIYPSNDLKQLDITIIVIIIQMAPNKDQNYQEAMLPLPDLVKETDGMMIMMKGFAHYLKKISQKVTLMVEKRKLTILFLWTKHLLYIISISWRRCKENINLNANNKSFSEEIVHKKIIPVLVAHAIIQHEREKTNFEW